VDCTRRAANDLYWIVPGSVLTLAVGAFALAQTPDFRAVAAALAILPLWLVAAGGMASLMVLGSTVRMIRSGADRPLARFRTYLANNYRHLTWLVAGLLLAGANMAMFMWVKQLLNRLVPFWADPLLANVDHAIFFTDPWRLLTWLDNRPLALFYHRVWFALLVLTLLNVLNQRPSREKTAILLTYFFLWSVFGPVIHTLLPAAGPVFYADLKYGDRFIGFGMTPETRELADYLWWTYQKGQFEPGGGISAMPSLHIATMAWIVIATAVFARRWLVPIIIVAISIWILSIALGWHYAIDGIVGAAGAFGIWRLCALMVALNPRDEWSVDRFINFGP